MSNKRSRDSTRRKSYLDSINVHASSFTIKNFVPPGIYSIPRDFSIGVIMSVDTKRSKNFIRLGNMYPQRKEWPMVKKGLRPRANHGAACK